MGCKMCVHLIETRLSKSIHPRCQRQYSAAQAELKFAVYAAFAVLMLSCYAGNALNSVAFM